ncbi:MAG: ABC transporter permease subunit, partial [Candidatus Methanomethylophilaceae archaeon]|nr:ABC transporter permease subunit [Candidatus Methanomethylophilaceae archaeon]
VSTMVITINVSGGIRTVPDVVTRASKMMGANGAVMFFKILLPYSSIAIINGLRLGLGSAWRVLIAAEMLIGTGIGLGSSMEILTDDLNFVGAFGCIVVVVIIGLIIDKILFSALEKSMRHRLGMEEGY